ncbi:MAG TPA: GNAT family N-acetyltransferase [Polyangiaceae bacterium]|jgi:GNAT superfamily N-acetyltransferase
MAALSRPARVSVRAALPGEGTTVAGLWRELWDAHEAWGGYPGSRDARVYAQLARRIDDDARVRAGHPTLGRHVHLVADLAGVPCGQVEGWFERHGGDTTTPFTCEVRSLIVTARARGLGAGKALLDELAEAAVALSAGAPCVLAAEVLDANPATSFYDRLGYVPVSYNARVDSARPGRVSGQTPVVRSADRRLAYGETLLASVHARVAHARDALAIACLEGALAARRRDAGDVRFDRPRAVDATMVGAIAAHLGADEGGPARDPLTLVSVDQEGVVRAAASFTTHPLEPPFVPMKRALLGRFAVDVGPVEALVTPLVGLACRLARAQGAPLVELTDLSAPGTPLHDAVLSAGAAPWSRVVARYAALAGQPARG